MASIFLSLGVALVTSLLNFLVQGDGNIELGLSILKEPHRVVVQKNAPILLNCSVIADQNNEIQKRYWTRNEQPITIDKRVNVFENGSLLIKRVIRKRRKWSDAGIYTCFVTNEVGTVIGRRVHLEIAYIAKHFTIQPQDQEGIVGSVARFECGIDAVPHPLYVWEKDQGPLPHDESRFTVLPSGILQISNIRASDAGKYRCRASQGLHHLPNKVDFIHWKISKESTLNVKKASGHYAPYFINTLSNITAVTMDNTIMECLADGIPRPTISWYFSDGEQIIMDSLVQTIGTGNLRFIEVTDEDTGSYFCQATSQGFQTIRREVRLDIQAPPYLTEVPVSYQYPIAMRIRLNCLVKGVPNPTVTWFRDGQKIVSNSRIKIQDENKLVISNSFVEHSGYYQCLVENTVGMTMATVRISVVAKSDAPRQPEGLIAQVMSSSAIKLQWDSVDVPSCCPLLAYSVHYQEVKTHAEKQEVPRITEIIIKNLKANTNYTFYIIAYNSQGASPHSAIVKAATQESVPNLAPKVYLRSDNSTSITVTWDELPEEETNGMISKYKIFYQHTDPELHMVEVDGAVTRHVLTGLNPDTEYRVRVLGGTSAGYPDLIDGVWPWVTQRTGEVCPKNDVSMTTSLTVTALNSTAVLICWDVKDDLPIAGIRLIVRRNTPDRGDSQGITIAAGKTSYKLGNLEEKTFYELVLMVMADNIVLDIDTEVFQTHDPLNAPQPPPPIDVRTVSERSTEIRVTWKRPKSSLPISHYTIQYYPLAPNTYGNTQETYIKTRESYGHTAIIDGLSPFSWYHVSVKSHTSQAAGPYSNWVDIQTNEDVPSPPENILYAMISPGQVELQWKPPSKQNGVIIYYIILYNQNDSEPEVFWKYIMKNGTLTSAVVSDLTDTVYYFKLRAETKAGKGQASPVLKIITKSYGKESSHPFVHDQQLGIILGVTIGLVSITVCVIIVWFRRRYRYNHIHNPHQNQASQAANGHAGGPKSSVPAQIDSTDVNTPMLANLPGNENLDTKGGDYLFIANRNGGKLNGFLLQQNGRLPGSNGWERNTLQNAEEQALLSPTTVSVSTSDFQQRSTNNCETATPDFDPYTVDDCNESLGDHKNIDSVDELPPHYDDCQKMDTKSCNEQVDDGRATISQTFTVDIHADGKVEENRCCSLPDIRQTDDDNEQVAKCQSDNLHNEVACHKQDCLTDGSKITNTRTSTKQNIPSKTSHLAENTDTSDAVSSAVIVTSDLKEADQSTKTEASVESYLNPVV